MTKQELKELITPEFLSTLKTILDHIYKYPNRVGIDWDEVDFLPGVMEDFVTGTYYEDDDPCPDCGTQLESASGGGVKCPNKDCGYWFCY